MGALNTNLKPYFYFAAKDEGYKKYLLDENSTLNLKEEKGVLMCKDKIHVLKDYIITVNIYDNLKDDFHIFLEGKNGYFTSDQPKIVCFVYDCKNKQLEKVFSS